MSVRIIFAEDIREGFRSPESSYKSLVNKIRKSFQDPNSKNYCGYWNSGRDKVRYLLLPKKLCRLLNEKLCNNNCNNGCAIVKRDESKYRDIVLNYELFFEKFFQFILYKFLELSPYLFPITQTKIFLKDSGFKIQSNVSIYLLLTYERKIKEACYTILHYPYMTLTKEAVFVSLSQVRHVSPEVVMNILTHPQYWTPCDDGIIKKRYSPYRVAQFKKKERFDTYENRVIKFILHYFLYLLKDALKSGTQSESRKKAKGFASWLEGFLRHTMWLKTGQEFPSNLYSQVLLKREGYRDLVWIYFLLQHTPLPAFLARDDSLLELKRMDRLWEYYCLVVILEGFKNMGYTFNYPVRFEEKDVKNEHYEHAKIELYPEGRSYRVTLTFQKEINLQGETKKGKLRPDFYLESYQGNDHYLLVLDAKFRLSCNLNPCELVKYLKIWGDEERGDNCLALTLRDERLDKNYIYRAVGYGDFASDYLYREPLCLESEGELPRRTTTESVEEINRKNLAIVLRDFLNLEIRNPDRGEEEERRPNKGWLGYVPLEIPKV